MGRPAVLGRWPTLGSWERTEDVPVPPHQSIWQQPMPHHFLATLAVYGYTPFAEVSAGSVRQTITNEPHLQDSTCHERGTPGPHTPTESFGMAAGQNSA